MARVCFSMLFLMALTACAADGGNLISDNQTLSQAQRMLACTGVPVAGQTCLLNTPKAQN